MFDVIDRQRSGKLSAELCGMQFLARFCQLLDFDLISWTDSAERIDALLTHNYLKIISLIFFIYTRINPIRSWASLCGLTGRRSGVHVRSVNFVIQSHQVLLRAPHFPHHHPRLFLPRRQGWYFRRLNSSLLSRLARSIRWFSSMALFRWCRYAKLVAILTIRFTTKTRKILLQNIASD